VKVIFKNILLVSLSFTVYLSCDTGTGADDLVVLSGSVYTLDEDNNIIPVEKALVTAENIYLQASTDQDGVFSFEFKPENDTANVRFSVTKTGFLRARTTFSAKKGQTYEVPAIELRRTTFDTSGSGNTSSADAAHIEVDEVNDNHIYVYSSGLKETAFLTFIVTDAEGTPVDDNHAETVHFSILNGPDGGEYLYPSESITTDGYAFTTLNSGTIAGPVQIEAYIERANGIIRSTPMRYVIYGGLPDDNHFSIAIDRVNIAGQVYFGIIDNVTAFVGDQYSNPVAPGTIVYFSTDYGIVDGAAATDELGRATVSYMSASPLPPTPAISSFANISAWTYGDTSNNSILSTDVPLLLSSTTNTIQVTPSSFQYNDSNTPQSFDYTVADIYGNPLVADTRITVEATAGDVFGDKNITLLDARYPGAGSTDFSFSWAPGDSLKAPQVYISIQVSTPENGNGYRSRNIVGTKVANP